MNTLLLNCRSLTGKIIQIHIVSTFKPSVNHVQFYRYFNTKNKPPTNNYKRQNWTIMDNMINAARNIWIVPLTLAIHAGIKQYQNDSQNPDSILTIENLDKIPPVDLPNEPEEIQKLMYRKVKLRGYFEHDKEFLLSQRTNVQFSDALVSPLNRSGYYVLTPFVLENGRRVLVNRGWVSEYRKKPESRESGQVQGTVELDAYVTFNEKMDLVTKMRTMSCKYFYLFRSEMLDNNLDMDKLAEKLQVEPFALFVADKKSTHKMGPIGGQISFKSDYDVFQQYQKVFSYLLLALVMYIIF
ncbi:surfeit locus protein 1-like [Dermatophagoides pteronyssinus]|uniref:surfeit locus protein 1-like n=1 Tax=Dermatophagoides pteronyssinus TaxID=6956 RepID=UPI003F66A7EE